MTTIQPSKDAWREIEERIMKRAQRVYLDCDGYLVTLKMERVGDFKLAIVPYVDGVFDAKWLGWPYDGEPGDPPTDIGRRFFPLRKRGLYQGKHKQLVRKLHGKQEAERKLHYRHPYWQSFTQLKRHLVAENQAIVKLDDETAYRRLGQFREVEKDASGAQS